MGETFVVNASPLIFLSRAGHLDLLRQLSSRVIVPKLVKFEINRKGPTDATVRAIESSPWIEFGATDEIPPQILAWGLGAGESSVLAGALNQRDHVAVLDDLAARKCAFALNIDVRGTLGLVLIAKRRKVIPLARPVMENLLRTGLHLSKSILDDALKRVGE